MPVYQPPPMIPAVDLVTPCQSSSVTDQNHQFLQTIESDYLHWDSAIHTQ